MGASFFSNPTDYTVVDEGGDGSGFYDGPAYTAIDPVAINNSVAEAAASAAASEASKVASGVSATASAASASASAVSAAAALVSQNAAAASATAADASDDNAVAQAAIATTKASEAATSAAAALVSEGNADTSETNAASSASAASTSASNASTSASNASTSEANAAASAAAALVSETNAAAAVQDAAGTATPIVDGVAGVGTGVKWAREDHVHPTDTSRADAAATTAALALKAPLASPALTGTPTAPTPSAADNSTKIATTAYVDTADALKAPLASPTFTGTPAAPTATVGTNTTQLATTAFVLANSGAAPQDLLNVSLAVGASAGALTIALKDAGGNDATASTPIDLYFRDAAGTTGARTKLSITAAASLTLSSGSTLGVTSSIAFRLWVVGFNDGGTFRLGAVLCTDAVSGRFALLEDRLVSSTAEGGAGGADSALTIYTGTAVTNKALRVLGYIEWSSSGLTAGTWTTTNINYVQTFGPGVKLPGEAIQRRWAYTTTATSNATSTFADTSLQKAITPTSAANGIKIHVQGGLLCPAAASRGAVQLRRGSGASGPQIGMVAEGYANSTTAIMPVDIKWLDYPQSASSVTYTAQVASQGNVGSVQFPQAPGSASNVYGFIEIEEIQS